MNLILQYVWKLEVTFAVKESNVAASPNLNLELRNFDRARGGWKEETCFWFGFWFLISGPGLVSS